MTGIAKRENCLILRIPNIPRELKFDFKIVPFPLKTTFAMTINKAQGHKLQAAQIHLKRII